MASKDETWVHRFVVSDPLKHSKGFTLYKVTSVVYPKRYPETATKVVVWKRYNDFKKLHSELKMRHSKLHLGDKFPPFVKAKYFSRFEEEVIEERRRAALLLLEFIAKHPPLYNSEVFVQFFEVGYPVTQKPITGELHADGGVLKTSAKLLSGLDQLSGPTPVRLSEVLHSCTEISVHDCLYDTGAYSLSSEDDVTSYVTDSESSFLISQNNAGKSDIDSVCENKKCNLLNFTDVSCPESHHFEHSTRVQNKQNKVTKQNENGFSKRLWDLTSTKLRINAFTDSNEKPEYCIVAEQYVEEAELKEAMKNHRAAFDLYKKAISCWLSGVQSDMNHNRRKIIKEKTSLYLLRAEFIANNYLTDDIPETAENELLPLSHLWRPITQLGSYKVLSIIGKVMLVMDTNTHSLFIIKPLLKSVHSEDVSTKCILPRGGPYIVNLHAVFETDSAVYLVIQHISTGKLWDYITPYFLKDSDALHSSVSGNNVFGNRDDKVDEISNNQSIFENNIGGPFAQSATDLTLNSSQSSLSSQCDTYLELLNDYVGTKASKNVTIEENNVNDYDVIIPDVENKTVSNKGNNNFRCPKMVIEDALGQPLNQLNNDLPVNNESFVNSSENINVGCGGLFKIVTDTRNILNDNYDIDTTTLVEKAQVLLKSVSETLSKSDRYTNINPIDLKSSSSSGYDCTEASAPHEELSNLSISVKSSVIRSVINENTDSGNIELSVTDALDSGKNNSIITTLNPSRLLPDYIRGCSPVSSGSDIGEVQWFEWGTEGRGLNLDIVIKWSSQLLVAINYFHLLGIIFRDLNPENILVGGDGNLRLTYQCQYPGVEPVLDYRAVKSLHIAPECFSVHGISKSVDWWSYGVIMYNLITGRSLSYYHPGGIFEHSIIYIPDCVPEQAKSLLEQLLKYDSSQRLGSGASGVEEIKTHPFFKGVNWEQEMT